MPLRNFKVDKGSAVCHVDKGWTPQTLLSVMSLSSSSGTGVNNLLSQRTPQKVQNVDLFTFTILF